MEFPRNATSVNKIALVETNFDLRRLAMRLSAMIQLCLSVSVSAAVRNAPEFH